MVTVTFTAEGQSVNGEVVEAFGNDYIYATGIKPRADDGWYAEHVSDIDYVKLAGVASDLDASLTISFEG